MKSFLGILAVMAAALAVVGWLIRVQDVAEPLVPNPENVVQNFVAQLSGGRYEQALEHLDDDLKSELQIKGLEQLDEGLEQKLGSYKFQLGGEEEEQGDEATYDAQLETDRRGVQQFTFELERDPATGLWEISSLDELEAAAEQ